MVETSGEDLDLGEIGGEEVLEFDTAMEDFLNELFVGESEELNVSSEEIRAKILESRDERVVRLEVTDPIVLDKYSSGKIGLPLYDLVTRLQSYDAILSSQKVGVQLESLATQLEADPNLLEDPAKLDSLLETNEWFRTAKNYVEANKMFRDRLGSEILGENPQRAHQKILRKYLRKLEGKQDRAYEALAKYLSSLATVSGE